jgi:GNAT superfamily N-acetyltransferase
MNQRGDRGTDGALDGALPAGFTCRPAVGEDISAAIKVINAAEMAEVGEALLEQTDLEADWAAQAFNPELDTIVVFRGEQMAAVGQVFDERADIHVKPEHRGVGIERALTDWSERRARQQADDGGQARIGRTVPTDSPAALMLAERGYEPLYDSWVLRLPEGASPAVRAPSIDVAIRPYRPGEERRVHAIVETAFSEWSGRSPLSYEQWKEKVLDRPDFEPSLLLVAVADQELVGAVFGIDYGNEGWVDQVAVVPTHRGHGIAGALLSAVHAVFVERGRQVFGLNTDSRTGALDLYLRLGMQVDLSFTRFTRAL